MPNKITWNKAATNWNETDSLWSSVLEIIISGGKKQAWDKFDKDKNKRRKIIRLIMDRKGIIVYDEKKEIQNIAIYLDDIKIIAEEIKRNVQIIHG